MVGNPNHPKKGSNITTDPIRNVQDLKTIKTLLANKPRDFAMFVMGINTGLRASDLIRLTVGQVRHLQPGDILALKEKKTQKIRMITINKDVFNAVQNLIKAHGIQDNDLLFASRKGGPLTVPSLNRLIKSWCESINLKGKFGSHTLRKTFGYHLRVTHETDLTLITDCFGHSSANITLKYLGIQDEEKKNVYMKCIG